MTIESIISILVFVFGLGSAWASLRSSVRSIEQVLNEEMKPRISDLWTRFVVVEDRVNSLWKDKLAPAQSLRALNERGLEILEKSGIKGIIDEYKNDLGRSLQLRNPSTAYDAAREAIACVMALPEQMPELVPKLKTIAFGVGADIDEVLFAGGIYFRDAVLTGVGDLERDQLA